MKKQLFGLLSVLLLASAHAQTVVYENDFESDTANPTNAVTGRFLGKFSGSTTQSKKFNLTNLPPHQYITVSFDVIVAMTWDGNGRGYIDTNNLAEYVPDNGPDVFKVSADARTMVHTTFASHDLEFYRYQSFPGTFPQDAHRPGTGATAINVGAGNWNLDWYWKEHPNRKPLPDSILLKDAIYHIEITYAHSTESTDLIFETFSLSSGTFQGDLDEWWGLDNVRIQVSDEPLTPITECVPQVVQSLIPVSATSATLYVVGEAGPDLLIQSSGDLEHWMNERRVENFSGFYKANVSLQPRRANDKNDKMASAAPITPLKVWRVQVQKNP